MASNCSEIQSYVFITTFYILQDSPHSTLYAKRKPEIVFRKRREKNTANRSFTLGVEYKIIFKVQHLRSNAECIKYMTITNSPFIAKPCSCHIPYCQIRAFSMMKASFIFSQMQLGCSFGAVFLPVTMPHIPARDSLQRNWVIHQRATATSKGKCLTGDMPSV